MECGDMVGDGANDPCAIIARSSAGATVFFASYSVLYHVGTQHGFWLSLGLGVLGCMAGSQGVSIRFYLLLALAPLLAADFTAMQLTA